GSLAPVVVRAENRGPSNTDKSSPLVIRIPDKATLGSALPSQCQLEGNAVTCQLPDRMRPGQVSTFAFQFALDSDMELNSVTKGAAITWPNDMSPWNNQAEFELSTTAEARNNLRINAHTTPFAPGAKGELAVNVRNAGPSVTTSPTHVHIVSPNGIALVGPMPKGCQGFGGQVTCEIPPGLAVNEQHDYAFAIGAPADAQTQTIFTGGVVKAENSDDMFPNDNARPLSISTGPAQTDLVLARVNSPEPITPGTAATVSAVVRNNGPSRTSDYSHFTFELPRGIQAHALGSDCGVHEREIWCAIPAGLDVGAEYRMNVEFATDANTPPNTTFGKVLVVQPTDRVKSNNDGQFSLVTADPLTDLMVEMEDSAPITPGTTSDVVLKVLNQGPSYTAMKTVVRYELPEGVRVGDLPAECVREGETISCALPPGQAPGTWQQVSVPLGVSATFEDGDGLTRGSVRAVQVADPDDDNNVADMGLSLGEYRADLTARVVDASAPSGQSGTVTAVVSNNGPSMTGQEAGVDIALPATAAVDTTKALPSRCTAQAGNKVHCEIEPGLEPQVHALPNWVRPPFDAGERELEIPIIGQTPAGAALDFDIPLESPLAVGQVSVVHDHDPGADNNVAPARVAVTSSVTTLMVSAPEEPVKVARGGRSESAITVRAEGPRTVHGTVVVFTLPPGIEADVSELPECAVNVNKVQCLVGVLGGDAQREVVVPISASTSATLGSAKLQVIARAYETQPTVTTTSLTIEEAANPQPIMAQGSRSHVSLEAAARALAAWFGFMALMGALVYWYKRRRKI
ncbi:MAG: hypothetical protein HOQ05_03600, partial [Corynebacteriales bacterium]|nr:hypothetical protein [Mycobacteriales bacterium]